MGPTHAFNIGFLSLWENKRIWLFYYGLNLIFAFLIVYPFRVLFLNYFSHSESLPDLLQNFDFMALTNFARDAASGLTVLFAVFLLLALVFWLLQYFFAGGAFYVYLFPERNRSFPSFFQMSARYFGPMFRLFLFSLVFGIVVIVIHLILLRGLAALKPHLSNEITSSLLRGGVLLITGIIFLFFKMIFDYAKAELVLSARRSAVSALFRASGFVQKHFFSTMGLFYLILFSGFFLLLIYLPLNHLVLNSTANSAILLFLFQQVFVIFQTGIRLQFYAAQGNYLKMETRELEI